MPTVGSNEDRARAELEKLKSVVKPGEVQYYMNYITWLQNLKGLRKTHEKVRTQTIAKVYAGKAKSLKALGKVQKDLALKSGMPRLEKAKSVTKVVRKRKASSAKKSKARAPKRRRGAQKG